MNTAAGRFFYNGQWQEYTVAELIEQVKRDNNFTKDDATEKIHTYTGGTFGDSDCYEIAIIHPGTKKIDDRAYFCALMESKLKQVIMHNDINEIDECAFRNSGITNMVIPSRVKGIKALTFAECPNLKQVTFEGDLVEEIHKSAFEGSVLEVVIIPPNFQFDLLEDTFRACSSTLNTIKIGEAEKVSITTRKGFDRYRYALHYLCHNGAPAKTIKDVANSHKAALQKKYPEDHTPFDMLFENDWESDQQLICVNSIPPLMSDFNVDQKTKLLSNDAMALVGPKSYPGFVKEKCFKLVCFMDLSSFKRVNTVFGMRGGDKAIIYYAEEIKKRLDGAISSLCGGEGKPKLYGTAHRRGGDEFVIIITGVLAANDQEVPEKIYKELISEDGLASITKEYINQGVFTFLRAGFCWSKMVNDQNQVQDINQMIQLAELMQDIVKKKVNIDRNDSKSLEAIRKEGKSNVSELIEYSADILNEKQDWLDERNKEEDLRLKSFLALGLADGYFWSFLKEIATGIQDRTMTYHSDGQQPEDKLKLIKRFIIILPMHLDWSTENSWSNPITDFVNSNKDCNLLKEQGYYFKNCQISNKDSARPPKWVTEVIMHNLEERIIIDVPSTINTLFMSLKEQCTSEEDKELFGRMFQTEVSAFQERLVSQLKTHNLNKHVTIVAIDNLTCFKKKIDDLNLNAGKG